MKDKLILPTMTVILVALFAQNGTELFTPGWAGLMIGTAGVAYALHAKKIMPKHDAYALVAIAVTLTVSFTFYVGPAILVASSAPTVLDDNWYNALNWIRNNTAECATIATYWDPGHFIRAIGHRTVVFDGGSQNHLLKVEDDSNKTGLVSVPYDNGITRVIDYADGARETARIQDIAASMMTANESLAVQILNDYRKPGCNETYFLASSDLIGKSVWWTYFATWSPEKKGTCTAAGITDPKGDCYQYSMLGLSGATPNGQSILYSYAAGANQAFIINYDTETGNMKAFFSENNNLHPVQSVFYFSKDGSGTMSNANSAEISGMLWVEPDRQTIIYMPVQLSDAIFTRLFFFNGAGLQHFEFVEQWGGEVKLFRVK